MCRDNLPKSKALFNNVSHVPVALRTEKLSSFVQPKSVLYNGDSSVAGVPSSKSFPLISALLTRKETYIKMGHPSAFETLETLSTGSRTPEELSMFLRMGRAGSSPTIKCTACGESSLRNLEVDMDTLFFAGIWDAERFIGYLRIHCSRCEAKSDFRAVLGDVANTPISPSTPNLGQLKALLPTIEADLALWTVEATKLTQPIACNPDGESQRRRGLRRINACIRLIQTFKDEAQENLAANEGDFENLIMRPRGRRIDRGRD